MSKINVLATGLNGPITTKSALKQLIMTSPELVRFVPVIPSPALVSAVPAYDAPIQGTFTVHSPTNRKWTATITRTNSHEFTVK